MSDHELDIENLPNSASIGASDELVVVDKSITSGVDADVNGKTSKIKFSELRSQILPNSPSNGIKGQKGTKGEPGGGGSQGAKGHAGEKGIVGISGTRGNRGFSGEKGEKGEASQPGIKGLSGSIGPRGDVGLDGEHGQKGDKGDKAISGPRGYRGDIGETGNTGPQGAKGEKGSVNTAVVRGYKGQKGPTGYSRKGEKGANGELGERGEKGEKGEKGKKGVDNENIVFVASDMTGSAWKKMTLSGDLMFNDTRKTGYNPNSRLLIKVRKGHYFGKWKTNNDLYSEVCLQNTDFIKGPTTTSGYLEYISTTTPYPILLMPYSEGSSYTLKVCVFEGTKRYDLPYEVFECDEF